jgi:hypothetical protein
MELGSLFFAQLVNGLPHEMVLTRPGAIVHPQNVEERRFTGTGWPHDRNELAFAHVKSDAA